MKTTNIKKQYQKLVSTLIDVKSNNNLPNELFSEVYVSEWVKIFLIGNVENKEIEVQIEILNPSSIPQESKISEMNRNMGALLRTQIEHLEYLLRLHKDNEFILDIIKEEGIWCGTKKLETEPTEDFISQLMPPKISSEKFSDKK